MRTSVAPIVTPPIVTEAAPGRRLIATPVIRRGDSDPNMDEALRRVHAKQVAR
ncbi:hypothetical protein ABZV29_16715 [Streptomyces sp. NPDC005236]|uniref:hypothetical protein n=1 Tax=Streptomyces sp. NPDC005236 TaxID=3157028 RepID=UPI0033AA59D1